MVMKKMVKKHPLAMRWFHWINFPILMVMTWSGLLIYWANDVYKLGWNDKTILKFFPQTFYDAFHLNYKLAQGMAFHFVFMWLFFINGFLYVLYTIIPENGGNSFQTGIHSKRHGSLYCTICICVNWHRLKKSIMQRKKLPIPGSLSWEWVPSLPGLPFINRCNSGGFVN